MWIANRKRREFTNVNTGLQITIFDDTIRAWHYNEANSYATLGKVNGPDDAMKKYAEILEILQLKQLLLVEYEE